MSCSVQCIVAVDNERFIQFLSSEIVLFGGKTKDRKETVEIQFDHHHHQVCSLPRVSREEFVISSVASQYWRATD